MTSRLSDDDLLELLDDRPERLERYLSDHPEDDRLDVLTALDPTVGHQLGAAMAPPTDLATRLLAKLRPDPLKRETASVLLGLFGLPWRTARVLVDGPEAKERST